MTTFYQSPQYLKGIRKIQSFNPEDKAITQDLVDSLAGAYAGRNFENQLSAMRAASLEQERARSLDLANRRLALSTDMFKTDKKQNKTAEALGYGNIVLSGISGLAEYRNKRNLQKTLNDLIGLYS